ncbi:MAG TPA: protein-disulfide reductase DsbD domain-containing protein [Parasegetibacter sp.]
MRLKHFFTSLIILFAFSLSVLAQQKGKQKLNVLYVGGSANWEKEAFSNKEEQEKDAARRMASFEAMLKRFFTDVKVIHANDYTQSMSLQYDVTVFDGTPKPVTERKVIKDESGRTTKVIPAGYFTEDFDKPVVFIGELGEKLGRSIGLKHDWYCLCLDAHAHNFKKEHEIFKGPFPVKMTIETRPTPEDAFHYEYFLGYKTPETLPMWRVQTKGYITDKNFRIGMVARPWGYEDSPDAESISSGVCQKTLDAVALGRHGNFFHWGFAASPEFMTDEAQTVLANAIVYISKFDGKGVIARKYLDRRATREYLKEKIYLSSREAYDSRVKSNAAFDERMLAEKKKAEEKKLKGEKLTESEERALSYRPQPKESFEDFVKRYNKDLFDQFGMNSAAYAKFYKDNRDYFYSHDEMYKISVDEDVKSLGIPYYDKRLLDKAISMLEKGEDAEKAKRILDRYTMADFATPAEWRKWFEENKHRMFFTETGGYYFMINTYDKSVPGNDYKTKRAKQSYSKIQPGETSHENAVSVAAGVIDIDSEVKEVVVKFRVHPGYHTYAYVASGDPYIPTEVKITLPEGYIKVGDLKKPSYKYFNEKGTTIYENEFIFAQQIKGAGAGVITCSVSYQCCDSQICFPPVEDMEYKVKVD